MCYLKRSKEREYMDVLVLATTKFESLYKYNFVKIRTLFADMLSCLDICRFPLIQNTSIGRGFRSLCLAILCISWARDAASCIRYFCSFIPVLHSHSCLRGPPSFIYCEIRGESVYSPDDSRTDANQTGRASPLFAEQITLWIIIRKKIGVIPIFWFRV